MGSSRRRRPASSVTVSQRSPISRRRTSEPETVFSIDSLQSRRSPAANRSPAVAGVRGGVEVEVEVAEASALGHQHYRQSALLAAGTAPARGRPVLLDPAWGERLRHDHFIPCDGRRSCAFAWEAGLESVSTSGVRRAAAPRVGAGRGARSRHARAGLDSTGRSC